MNRIVEVLMKRDGMTEQEAWSYMKDVRTEVENATACGDYELAEDIFTSDLGLEMDYIFDLLV